ncbi:MAG: HK97 gp10 family phage protein [Spirochaetaceae bacterium]
MATRIELEDLTAEMLNAERDAQRRALNIAAKQAEREMDKRAPEDEGDYKRGLFAEVPDNKLQLIMGAKYTGRMAGGSNHAHLIEFGTGPRFTRSGAYRGAMPSKGRGTAVIRKSALVVRRYVVSLVTRELKGV